MVVPTELTPVLNETNDKAARIRSFAIIRWLLCANSACSMTDIYMYAPIYILLNFIKCNCQFSCYITILIKKHKAK